MVTTEQAIAWALEASLDASRAETWRRFAALAYAAGERAMRERVENLVKECTITYTPAGMSLEFAPIVVKMDLRPLIFPRAGD